MAINSAFYDIEKSVMPHKKIALAMFFCLRFSPIRHFRHIGFVVLFTASVVVQASDDLPLWELGVGAGYLSLPVYRGADQRRDIFLPIPYFVYRGEILKSDRRGVRGTLFDSDRVEISLSATASLPVGAGEVEARQGMPGLKTTLGFGPSVDMSLWRSDDGRLKLSFQLPVRGVFTIESRSEFVGFQAAPKLNIDITHPAGFDGWHLGLQSGPVYGSRLEHEYFYSVPQPYATSTRREYSAPGGYAGMMALAAFSKRYPRYWVGGFVRYDSLKGAVFDNSPLFRRQSYLAAGFGIAWIIGESSRRVTAED